MFDLWQGFQGQKLSLQGKTRNKEPVPPLDEDDDIVEDEEEMVVSQVLTPFLLATGIVRNSMATTLPDMI